MKKIYIAPNVQVVKVETQNMMQEMSKHDETTKGFDQSLAREGGLVWELEEVTEEE